MEERESKFNGHLRVVRTFGLGTYIQADGLTQSGGIVERIWKQALRKVHGSLITVHRSLILGLGGGTAAKLIQKYWPWAKIVGVEIDPVMVELGKRYLRLDSSKTKITIQDAYDYCLVPNAYDLVVVDLYHGDKFPKKFESEKFLKRLTKNGMVIFNRLYFGDKRSEAVKFGKKLEKIFPRVEYFYPEANLILICYNR